MLIVLGILTIIAGFVSGGILIKSQLNFHTDETTTDVKQQLNTPVVASTSTSQSQNTVGTMGLEMPTYIDARQQVSLEFGGTLFAFKWGDLAKGSVMPVIIAGQTVPLKIFADDNHLLWVDVSIIGMGNLPIVELKKNTLQNGIPSGWDYNSDRNIFEVVNQNLEPVLQVIRMGPFSERVNGIFPLSNGGLVQASPSGGAQYYGPGVANQAPLQGFHLDPIFKYPSNQYLGVQVTSE